MRPTNDIEVYLCRDVVDFRKSINGLSARVEEQLGLNPLGPQLFVFCNGPFRTHGFWQPWTFPFGREGRDVAFVRKKWSGLLKESFTDADNFKIEFVDPSLTEEDRTLVLAAGLFIDPQYFERKAEG